MAKLTADDVKHVAKLAKLDLTDSEIKKFQGQLSKVIDYVTELGQVDTSSTQPTSQTTGLGDVFRNDTPNPFQTLSVEDALSQGKKVHNNYFAVPGILAKDQ